MEMKELDDHTIGLIEQYIAYEMPAEERQQFEQRLKQDAALAEELELRRMAEYFLSKPKTKPLGDEEKQRALDAWQEGIRSEKQAKRRKIWTISLASVAAATLLIFWVTSQIRVAALPPETQNTIAELQRTYMKSSGQLGGEQLLMDAQAAFDSTNYSLTIDRLNQYREQTSDKFDIEVYKTLGFAYMLDGQADQACVFFKKLHNKNPNDTQFTWYYALSLLQTNSYWDRRKGAQLLKELEQSDHVNIPQDATRLLEKMPTD